MTELKAANRAGDGRKAGFHEQAIASACKKNNLGPVDTRGLGVVWRPDPNVALSFWKFASERRGRKKYLKEVAGILMEDCFEGETMLAYLKN